MGFWRNQDLEKIGHLGFKKLGIDVDRAVIAKLATEALHSPQLMQTLCLETCRAMDADVPYERQRVSLENFNIEDVKRRAVKSYDQATQFHLLQNGPALRGKRRSLFRFRDGGQGDVYNVLTRVIALDPPFVSISLEQIKERARAICREGEEPNVRAALKKLSSVFRDGDDPIQWDDQKRLLAIIDPHFYFYLRCQLPTEFIANEKSVQASLFDKF